MPIAAQALRNNFIFNPENENKRTPIEKVSSLVLA
jgi:hypothetical protein